MKITKMDLYKEFSEGKERKERISGTIIKNYVESPFLVYCNFFAPENEMDPDDPYMLEIMEQGKKHEDKIFLERYPTVKEIEWSDIFSGFKNTLMLMEKGEEVILNGVVMNIKENMSGVPDILIKDDSHKSRFGEHHYTVCEVKSSKNIKEKHIMQAAFYNYLIGKIQGYTPEKFFLINRDNEMRGFEYYLYSEKLKEIIFEIEKIIDKKTVPSPDLGKYPWSEYGLKIAIKQNDLCLINGIGRGKRELLLMHGIKNVSDMANADTQKLGQVKGLGYGSVIKWKNYAKALILKKAFVFGKYELPENKEEIYFDFEGTDENGSTEKVDYLIGCYHKGKYKYFFSENETDTFKEFLLWLQNFDKYTLYHYGTYEKTALKRVAKKYGINVKKKVYDSMFDLFKIVKSHAAFPTYSSSLKDVAKYLKFKWRDEIGGQRSILLYRQYLIDKDDKKLKKILEYNEDDCKATLIVKEFLEKSKYGD